MRTTQNSPLNEWEAPVTIVLIFLTLFQVSATAQTNWWNASYSYRIPLKIEFTEAVNKPVELPINFTKFMKDAGSVGAFNSSSIRVIEVDKAGRVIDQKLPFQFDRDENFDSVNNAAGTLTFLMKDRTTTARYYQIYFDTNNAIRGAITSAQVILTDNYFYEGQNSYKISTNSGTYIYHKQGAGFASLMDQNGNDWIGYHQGNGSSGEARGVPNLGEFGHPGYTNATSKIIQRGPLKISILSETTDGKNQVQWDIFPDYARMTLLKSEKPYSFLYEGTPAGKLDLETAFSVNSAGRKTYVRQDWNFDLPAPEWIYFGDEKVRRVLFFAHHEDDNASDQSWQMDDKMTVFGFGRKYRCCERYLTKVPAHFTLGLVEDSGHFTVSKIIGAAFQSPVISTGKIELRESLAVNIGVRPIVQTITTKNIPTLSTPVEFNPALTPAYKNKPEHQFFAGYCTWYVARKWKNDLGSLITWSGDGGAWYVNAEAEGRKVSLDARDAVPGAIMVWTRGGYGKGHVAFVESVEEDGIHISEMNVRGRYVVSTAVIPFDNLNKGTKYKFRGIILPE